MYTLSIIGIAAFFAIIFMLCNTKKRPPLPAKDPLDYTKTDSSTHWKTTQYSCEKCLAVTYHDEHMASICSKCGNFGRMNEFNRIYRKIWNGTEWKYQYKFNDGRIEILDKPYSGDE